MVRWPFLLVCAAGVVACGGDRTASVGDNGKLRYELQTNYEVPESDLRDARIVTGHRQELKITLTDQGRDDVDNPEALRHALKPSAGTTVETLDNGSESDPPDVRITVASPGTYTLESRQGGDLVDKITLTFAEPAGFEIVTRMRGPWESSFVEVAGDPITLEEGSQVVLLPIPLDAKQQRLAGELSTEVGVSPAWAVTPGMSVIATYEQGVWSAGGEIDFYFIEPATVTFSIQDPVSKAVTDQAFDVTPVVKN